MEPFAETSDLIELWRPFKCDEEEYRAEKLLKIVSDCLREEADRVGKDLDEIISKKPFFESVVKINYNMRCIEMRQWVLKQSALFKINYNMRCIEIFVSSFLKMFHVR